MFDDPVGTSLRRGQPVQQLGAAEKQSQEGKVLQQWKTDAPAVQADPDPGNDQERGKQQVGGMTVGHRPPLVAEHANSVPGGGAAENGDEDQKP